MNAKYSLKHKALYYLTIFLIGSLLSACLSSKNWQSNQYLLRSQQVKGNKQLNEEQISSLFRQEPNRRFNLFVAELYPYVWFYYQGKKIHKPEKIEDKIEILEEDLNDKIVKYEDEDKLKKADRLRRKLERKLSRLETRRDKGNWLMRTVGEAPVFLDTTELNLTQESIQNLLYAKGFFQGKVRYEIDSLKRRRLDVLYIIEEGERSRFGEMEILTSKPEIEILLTDLKAESNIQKGDYYDADLLSAERARVEKALRNEGYLFFNRQYVNYLIDTLHFARSDSLLNSIKDSSDRAEYLIESQKREANINLLINDPKSGEHKPYNISQVSFHVVDRQDPRRPDSLLSADSKVNYVFKGKRPRFSHRLLDRRIKIRPGQRYSEFQTIETQRSLWILDMFKFVNINTDTLGREVSMNIFVSPLEKYQITDEIGLNVTQGLPGPFVNVSLKNRNTFGGMELFENSFRFTIDGQTGLSEERNFYSSQEISFNSSLRFPQVLFPTRLRFKFDDYNPTTRLSAGFSYVRRPEYTRSNLSAAIVYQGQRKFSNYNFTLAELSIVNTTDISDAFNQQLLDLSRQGNPIIESFDRALVSSIYLVYTFNNNQGNESKRSHFIRLLLEAGGSSLGLLRRSPFYEDSRLFGLRVFQYWRINPTFHYYLPLNKKQHSLAFRVNAGLAQSYGNSAVLPYEKYFFSGGTNSVRAWSPRRLGPGAARPSVNLDGTFDYSFEQPGEIILEGNVEYRFPLMSFIRGALFIDAGNVWTVNEDPNRPGGEFRFDSFIQQLAIGTGFGLRFNLPFLLFRLDLGLKVYDPARRGDRRWVIREFDPLKPAQKDLLLLNIGIGYPF